MHDNPIERIFSGLGDFIRSKTRTGPAQEHHMGPIMPLHNIFRPGAHPSQKPKDEEKKKEDEHKDEKKEEPKKDEKQKDEPKKDDKKEDHKEEPAKQQETPKPKKIEWSKFKEV